MISDKGRSFGYRGFKKIQNYSNKGRDAVRKNYGKSITTPPDLTLVCLLIIILAVSVFFLTTASRNVVVDNPLYYVRRQLFMISIGLVAMVIVATFDYRRYKGWFNKAYIAVLVALVITLFFGTGEGSNRWILGVQPSEVAKLAMIVLFAAYLDSHRKYLKDPIVVLRGILFMAVPMGLIFLEPDLGTSLVFLVILIVMLFVSGANRKIFWLLTGSIIALIVIVFISLSVYTKGFTVPLESRIPWLPFFKPYQLMRLAIFINPEMDAMGNGYHIIQSKIAVGSGGLIGKGYGRGTQVQSNFLPEHHTDFIFSVIGEEFGFIVSALVLLLLMVFLIRIIQKAYYARDFFGTLIISGIGSMMLFQIFENVGMAIGIMPVTGLPLPFFSYGGTNMVMNLCAVGLVLSISMRGKKVPSLTGSFKFEKSIRRAKRSRNTAKKRSADYENFESFENRERV